MIPLAAPNLTGNERKYLNYCIDTTFVSSVGQYVIRMEEMCKDACGTDFAVATSSGTTGLHAMLLAAGVGRNDLVILPTFTFIASANAITHCGASPWLFDIGENWCLDAVAVEIALENECSMYPYSEWIVKRNSITGRNGDNCATTLHDNTDSVLIHNQTGRHIAAIMPVYTLGNIPDMERFRKIADRYGVPLIADAACAIGATYHGKQIGGLADMSVLSFNGNKTITCGGGGMVIGNNENQMNYVRHITTTARIGTEYDFDMVGYNYRMTNVQAAIGCAQMERLDEFINRKQEIRMFYRQALEDCEGISFFPETEGSAVWYSGIILKDGGIERVREICAALKEQGIEARSFWKPVHLQRPYQNVPVETVEHTERIWYNIVTLPCSTGISDKELKKVADCIRTILTIGSGINIIE